MSGLLERRPDLLPSFGVAAASVLWGLFWLPLRYLDERGLVGAWPGLALFAVSSVLLLPVAALRWRRLAAGGPGLLLTGLITGAAFTFYATGLLLTEVVRVLLLFYLTPVWSTLLGFFLLRERITLARSAALFLGIAGMTVVLGLGETLPLPRNIGDWMALVSGFLWSYGTLRIYREDGIAAFEQSFVFVAGACLVSAVTVFLPLSGVGAAPAWPVVQATAVPLLLVVLVLVLPVVLLTLWGARRLSPARVGLLLMGEVAVGVASAAILTDEPFGPREILGTILVLAAAGVEVVQRQPDHPAVASPPV
jgi:drug/metabolite transporter (DMT)-like permease